MSLPRAGVDTGGTFTDAVLPVRGGWRVHKRPTVPERPEQGVLNALAALVPEDGPAEMVHGTTLATNALLTGRLARTVLVTTKGFADVLAIGRQERPVLYDLEPRPPRPPQPRGLIVETRERLAADGAVVQPLQPSELRRVRQEVAKRRPAAVAVCLLHAYRQPKHERLLGGALKTLGVPVVLSSEVAPEYREYERSTTAWAHAALHPVVAPALAALAAALARRWGRGSQLRVMRSDGGTCTAAAAAARPLHLALSGPAGGLSAARTLADARGDGAVLSFDMGGTSTDVALLGKGALPLEALELAGLPLLARGLPVHSVGTGGGSLAAWDRGGALQVGPASAGARPGPACYGRGGRAATVTDAHLVAGRLHPGAFLGGEFPLQTGCAEAALTRLGRGAELGPRPMAEAVLEVATAGMERALRRVSLAAGHDTRGLVLYAFGGAGGLHACWLAGRLGMPRVVVPPLPGAFSALGLLAAPARRTLARSVLKPLPEEAARKRLFGPLVRRAVAGLVREGVRADRVRLQRVLELRGEGQAGEFVLAEGPRARERFHREHRRRFGYDRRDRAVILVAVRVTADGPRRRSWRRQPSRRGPAHPFARARIRFPEAGRSLAAPWYRREELAPGQALAGPAGIAEYSGTTVLPPDWRAEVDAFGALEMEPV